MKVFYKFLILSLFLIAYQKYADAEVSPCKLRPTSHGSVCVCTEDYCDYMEDSDVLPTENGKFTVISSSSKGLRFSRFDGAFGATDKIIVKDHEENFSRSINPLVILNVRGGENKYFGFSNSQSYQRTSKIFIDRREKYQTIEGFGGAFTGSVAHILDQIPENLQNHVYKSYYSTGGIGYNMMRLSIGGCDFDLEPWAYNEEPQNEVKLTNFTKLDPRDEDKITKIKKLMKVSNKEDIKFKAAAWSPPRWMKTNKKWTGLSFLKKEYYQTWADYHLRFLELMAARNISIWAISTGNEPLNGVIGWFFVRFMSLGWTAGNQGTWVEQNLGPTIRNSPFKNVKILGNDDQRYTFPQWFKSMESSAPKSLSYIDGFAVHWYWDPIFGPSLIDETLKLYGKGRIFLTTESCVGDKPYETHGPELGSWERGEKYCRLYIENLLHGSNGWIDWNLVLDETGGPNYVNNFVDAAVIVKSGGVNEIYKQPIFYAIGHFSKFLPEGSVRIKSERWNINIDTVAFLRPDGYVACIIYNSGRASVDIKITDAERGAFVINVPERSFHTLIYK